MNKVSKNRRDRIAKKREKGCPTVKIKSSVLNDWLELGDGTLETESSFCCFVRDKHFKEFGGRQGYLKLLKTELQLCKRFINEWSSLIQSKSEFKQSLVPNVMRYEVLNSRVNNKKITIMVGRQIREFWIP
jgi:hypothetical protein